MNARIAHAVTLGAVLSAGCATSSNVDEGTRPDTGAGAADALFAPVATSDGSNASNDAAGDALLVDSADVADATVGDAQGEAAGAIVDASGDAQTSPEATLDALQADANVGAEGGPQDAAPETTTIPAADATWIAADATGIVADASSSGTSCVLQGRYAFADDVYGFLPAEDPGTYGTIAQRTFLIGAALTPGRPCVDVNDFYEFNDNPAHACWLVPPCTPEHGFSGPLTCDLLLYEGGQMVPAFWGVCH